MVLSPPAHAKRRDLGPAERATLRSGRSADGTRSPAADEQARRLARDRLEPLLVRVDPGEAVHEADRVRVPWRVEDREDVAELDDPARVHDDDAVGELRDEPEVVRDEDDRGVASAPAPP